MKTRKEAHAEAVKMLQQAADLIDQAHALLKDARTEDSVSSNQHTGRHSDYLGIARFSDLSQGIADAASYTVCEDCDLLIAACDCKWVNEEAGK